MSRTAHLPVFLLLSLAAHVALLASWRDDRARAPTDDGLPTLGDGSLTVALYGHPPAPRRAAARAASDIAPAPPMSARIGRTSAAAQLTADVAAAREAAGTQAETSSAARNHLLGQVRREFARYFYYPAIARERGWEGRVVVGFSLQADGHLEKIYIARSSGYHVLDESARDTLGKVGAIAEGRQWLKGRGFDLQLPVIYRLLDR